VIFVDVSGLTLLRTAQASSAGRRSADPIGEVCEVGDVNLCDSCGKVALIVGDEPVGAGAHGGGQVWGLQAFVECKAAAYSGAVARCGSVLAAGPPRPAWELR